MDTQPSLQVLQETLHEAYKMLCCTDIAWDGLCSIRTWYKTKGFSYRSILHFTSIIKKEPTVSSFVIHYMTKGLCTPVNHMFKSLHSLAPRYLSELLLPYNPIHSLRSSGSGLLSVPRSQLSNMGGRLFSGAAPKIWNSLPLTLRVTSISEFQSYLSGILEILPSQGYLS